MSFYLTVKCKSSNRVDKTMIYETIDSSKVKTTVRKCDITEF